MALMDCPDCGARVSDTALACPKCGFDNPGETVRQWERQREEQERKTRVEAFARQALKTRECPRCAESGKCVALEAYEVFDSVDLYGGNVRDTTEHRLRCTACQFSVHVTFDVREHDGGCGLIMAWIAGIWAVIWVVVLVLWATGVLR
jgi:hypothetical protein